MIIKLDSDMEEFAKHQEKVLTEMFGKEEAERLLHGEKNKSSKSRKKSSAKQTTVKQTKEEKHTADVPARFADDLQQPPVDINKIKWACRPTNKEDW